MAWLLGVAAAFQGKPEGLLGAVAFVLAVVLVQSKLSAGVATAAALLLVGVPLTWHYAMVIPGEGANQLLFGSLGDDYRYVTVGRGWSDFSLPYSYEGWDLYRFFPGLLAGIYRALGGVEWLWGLNALALLATAMLVYSSVSHTDGVRSARAATIFFCCWPENFLWVQTYYKETVVLFGLLLLTRGLQQPRSTSLTLFGTAILGLFRAPFLFCAYLVGLLSVRGRGYLGARGVVSAALILVAIASASLVLREHLGFLFRVFFAESRFAAIEPLLPGLEGTPALAYAVQSFAGFLAVFLQPFPFWSEVRNVFDNLRVWQIPSGVYWYGVIPLVLYSANQVRLRNASPVFLSLALFCAALLAIASIFYTGRHRFAVTAVLIVAGAAGSFRNVRPG